VRSRRRGAFATHPPRTQRSGELLAVRRPQARSIIATPALRYTQLKGKRLKSVSPEGPVVTKAPFDRAPRAVAGPQKTRLRGRAGARRRHPPPLPSADRSPDQVDPI
jgi:hypothetical protein